MRAFRIAYDGRPFYGFQRQPDVPTVEDALFYSFRKLGLLDEDASKPDGYAAAGRTDAGVSAIAQTVAFDCPDWCSPRAINCYLPADVRAWAVADVPDDFHARHDAVQRAYVYHLYAPAASPLVSPSKSAVGSPTVGGYSVIDDDLARAALADLCGDHDFHNLTPDDHNTRRTLSGSIERDGDFLVVRIASEGFVREQVRRLVSLIHAIAAGAAPRSKVERVLGPERIDGREGIAPAPPTPLVLTDVSYPDVEFERDPDAAESAREVFAKHHLDGRIAVRVADEIRRAIGE